MIRTEWQKLTKHSRTSDSNSDESQFKDSIYKKPQMLKSICGFFVFAKTNKIREIIIHFRQKQRRQGSEPCRR